ncbi:hypothetical protein BRC65_01720 [Halobacteriales archaeon QH_2_65_14]|nr:MAG: hypothetical protein BRC65_01720 [Halobacteriales archaeon QH_2_65_14]
MGTDGLIELDQECWVAFAKYNLVLATVFGVLAVASQTLLPANDVLLVQNSALTILFGSLQTYAWLSA